jgi:hypothetical protein
MGARFRERRAELRTRARAGGPRPTEHFDAIRGFLADCPCLSQNRIGYIQGIHQSTMKCDLHTNVWLQKVSVKSILHLLGDDQKLERSRLSTWLLEVLESKLDHQFADVQGVCYGARLFAYERK